MVYKRLGHYWYPTRVLIVMNDGMVHYVTTVGCSLMVPTTLSWIWRLIHSHSCWLQGQPLSLVIAVCSHRPRVNMRIPLNNSNVKASHKAMITLFADSLRIVVLFHIVANLLSPFIQRFHVYKMFSWQRIVKSIFTPRIY